MQQFINHAWWLTKCTLSRCGLVVEAGLIVHQSKHNDNGVYMHAKYY